MSRDSEKDNRASPTGSAKVVPISRPKPAAETVWETVANLAGLSDLEFEQVRKARANELGIRVSRLDGMVAAARRKQAKSKGDGLAERIETPLEPWPTPVDGAAMLAEVSQAIRRHIVLSPEQADAVALWIVHAHLHGTAAISPILAISSPAPECGKTTLMMLLAALAPRVMEASNITVAAVFRSIEKWKPTLLVDEADTFFRHSDELRGIVNSGHNRAMAYVVRTVGEEHEPTQFSTWCPKAIALIGKLPETVASRGIHIELHRKTPDEEIVQLRGDRRDSFLPLKRRIARWAADYRDRVAEADPKIPAGVGGRRADNWRHMFAIADAAGGDWPERARFAALSLGEADKVQTEGVRLLACIRHILEKGELDRIGSEALVAALSKKVDHLWDGEPPSKIRIAQLLRPFRISPGTIRIDGLTCKGYMRAQFKNAFRRYLPERNVTPSQRRKSAGIASAEAVTRQADVTAESGGKAAECLGCDGVTAQATTPWEDEL